MYLEKAKIVNFRGIRKLSINFEEDNTVLIGENHWGKTSLLRALWMVLGRGEKLCNFDKKDLYVPVELNTAEDFPKDNLVEKVTRRKAISFEKEAVEEYRKHHRKQKSVNPDENLETKTSSQANYLAPDTDTNAFFEDIKDYLDSYTEETNDDVFETTDNHIRIDLVFRENIPAHPSDSLDIFKPYTYYDDDGFYRIHWQIVAFFSEEKHEFITIHNLVNKANAPFKHEDNFEEALLSIIRLNPVFRLRDSRMDRRDDPCSNAEEKMSDMSRVLNNDNDLSSGKANSLMNIFGSYLDKYLSNYNQNDAGQTKKYYDSRNIDEMVKSPISLESLASIKQMLATPGFNKSKALLSYIASAMFLSKGDRQIDKDAQPIMILEDIEGRFHPSLLLSFWSLLSVTDSQKILTTNSGDLLSAISLTSLRRLHRKYYDTMCYQIDTQNLNNDDLRRIAFHVRLNRPMALFARTWILVEGETEVWVLTQIAAILGISLACEGIRIIEFAQCGLKPLMKLASQLGIDFHVLTDVDDAGKKYAETTLNFISRKKKKLKLTVIPQKDIEHYLYTQGYERTFRQAAGLPNGQLRKNFTMDKIIDMAIKRKSKPGLALILVDAIQKRGIEGVQIVFAKLLQAVRTLGHDKADNSTYSMF